MTFEEANLYCKNSLVGHLHIEFTGWNNMQLEAKMPVANFTKQPMGYLHGGASVALAETVGGAGSMLLIDTDKYNVFGMSIAANHLASVQDGFVYATARIIHKGRTSHVWDIEIKDESGSLISVARITNSIVVKR